ncbi:MAG: hypothetical protein MJZ54_05545 [Bacteroidaceae bacterium]|nr:hypothetical protein [Bacteroidaceae bacterium]
MAKPKRDKNGFSASCGAISGRAKRELGRRGAIIFQISSLLVFPSSLLIFPSSLLSFISGFSFFPSSHLVFPSSLLVRRKNHKNHTSSYKSLSRRRLKALRGYIDSYDGA